MMSDPQARPEELWGIEDPRIVYAEELGVYAITYTAVSINGPGVALSTTTDFPHL
jgi:beta-1,4-mannooligosaccharide/beta-1,4-mannosyl-N-acetylglucosamine phosphorylase